MSSPKPIYSLFGMLLLFVFSNVSLAQSSCPVLPNFCHSSTFCAGVNTGFFSYWTLDRPFIDQARGAGMSVSGYTPDSVVRNSSIPLDANKYPTDTGKTITVLFNASTATTHQAEILPAGQYVILWDGVAVNPDAKGGGASGVIYNPGTDPNRIEFTFDPNPVANTWFSYENAAGGHVTNIRIVPLEYESDYENWNWNNYQIGDASNPPIFFPQWLEKMSSGCVVRYTQAVNTNDQDAIFFERDSSATRIYPSYAVWFQGFNLGNGAFGPANQSHIWPWELIVEATLQTQTIPWINFRAYTYENLVGSDGVLGTGDDDSLVTDVASMFGSEYAGTVYVEYGNEIWNYGWPFNVATNHIENNGPGINNNLEENYTLRTNAIQKAFADGYVVGGADSCDALGVLASQARAPARIQNAVTHADLDYIDVLSAASYVGGDVNPQSTNASYVARWDFISNLYDDVPAVKTQAQAFAEISNELLTGNAGLVAANWQNDMIGHLNVFKTEADASPKTCLAIYESGLHWRLDGLDVNDTQHMGVAGFMRDYHRSQELADVEIEMNNWFINNDIGPSNSYTNFMSAGWGTFSYWDWTFEDVCGQAPRAAMIGAYSNGTTLPIGQHPNQAPSISAVSNQSSFVSDTISLQLVGSDPENDTITYSATGLPSSLAINSSTGLITGTTDTVGGYTVEVDATDEHGLTSCTPVSFDWTVSSQNTSVPEITSPPAQSTLSGATEVFGWIDNGANVTEWWVYAGSNTGGAQYFNSGSISSTTTTASATGLPIDGSPVYVRLWYRLAGSSQWFSVDETYTAFTGSAPEITLPSLNSTLSSTSETFTWTANGQNVTDWWLYAGSIAGGRQYYDSGALLSSTTTINTTGLPEDGSDVHVTLWYKLNGVTPWYSIPYVYTAATGLAPEISTPVPNTTLSGSVETFTWTPNGVAVSQWWIYAGSSAGGSQYYSSGSLPTATTTVNVAGLPLDGSQVHLTLWYKPVVGSWTSIPYIYTAATGATPEIQTPLPGSTLTGSSETFNWTDNGTGVTEWWIYAGSTSSGSEYFDSGSLGAATSVSVTGLPGGGNPVFVTLWYRMSAGGSWQKFVYSYTSN